MSSQKVLFTNISEALTLQGVAAKDGRGVSESDLGLLPKPVIAVVDGRIAWIGEKKKFGPKERQKVFGKAKPREVDLKGRVVMPGFVECHTHLIFAGDRKLEFEWRNQGASYQEISARGGGIRTTVEHTRAASAPELRRLGQARVDRFLKQGVTLLEIKSGYGLDLESELKILKAARMLRGPEIVTTFLGPHAVAPEFKNTSDYLEFLQHNILPRVAEKKLAERVDVFIEKGFFTNEQALAWFESAKKLGFAITAHTDQLTAGGSSSLVAGKQALSVDHAIHLSDGDIQKIAKTSTTVVLLPTSDFYLRVPYPRARDLIKAGARVALATDFNPGTSPSQDLSLVGVLARLEMKMTLAETLAAYTFNAAAALGRQEEQGHLSPGAFANFAVLDGSWRDLFYEVGRHTVDSVWRLGRPIAFS